MKRIAIPDVQAIHEHWHTKKVNIWRTSGELLKWEGNGWVAYVGSEAIVTVMPGWDFKKESDKEFARRVNRGFREFLKRYLEWAHKL